MSICNANIDILHAGILPALAEPLVTTNMDSHWEKSTPDILECQNLHPFYSFCTGVKQTNSQVRSGQHTGHACMHANMYVCLYAFRGHSTVKSTKRGESVPNGSFVHHTLTWYQSQRDLTKAWCVILALIYSCPQNYSYPSWLLIYRLFVKEGKYPAKFAYGLWLAK